MKIDHKNKKVITEFHDIGRPFGDLSGLPWYIKIYYRSKLFETLPQYTYGKCTGSRIRFLFWVEYPFGWLLLFIQELWITISDARQYKREDSDKWKRMPDVPLRVWDDPY